MDENKIPVSQLIKNTWFILRYAASHDRRLVISIIGLYCFIQVGNAVYDTVLLKIIIQMLGDKSSLQSIIIVLMVSVVVMITLVGAQQLMEEWTKAKLVRLSGSIQKEIIEKCGKIDLMCYDTPDFYDTYVTAATKAEEMIQKGVTCVSQIVGSTLAMIAAAIVIMTVNPLIAIFPVLGFIANLLTRFKITRLQFEYELVSRKFMRKADYSKRIFYQPEFAKEVKLTNVREPMERQFDQAMNDCMEAGRKYGIRITWISLINWILVYTVFSFFCVPAFLGYLALVLKSIVLGDVAAMNNAANTIRQKLNQTNFALVDFQIVGQYAERFRKFMDYEVQIENHQGEKEIPHGNQTLELRDVSFRYKGMDRDVLQHVDMTIHPGEKVAIVGENGAGKTTFVKLLMRLYDVTGGSISFGGEDVRNFTTSAYRDKIGAVFQDYQIYAGTLRENVCMDPDSTFSDEEISAALEQADFSNRLATLPKGLDTILTREFDDKGVNLSGGESQKVAISRMFIRAKNHAVSILDEPSSALDPVSEYHLNENMICNAKDSTILFISHRLSTTRMADHIYLFDHGTIKEHGNHDELMELGGQYRTMFDRQAKYYKLDQLTMEKK